MDLNLNFYNKEIPEKGDIITIKMSEPENDIFNSSIEEYPKHRAIMQIGDLTSKKRIRSVRQYLHKKPVPAEITDIDNTTGIISVTRRYLKGIEGKYANYYLAKLKLLNLVKNIIRKKPTDLETLVKEIIHPLIDYIYKKSEETPPDIFKIIEENLENEDFPNLGKYTSEVKSIFDRIFREKPKKIITKFKLICSVSVNNIVKLFTILNDKYPKVKFKLDTCPNYYLETFGVKEKEDVIHQEVISFLKKETKDLAISFKIEKD